MADGQGGQNSSHRTEQATDVKEGEIGSRDHRCSWMGRRPRSGRGMRKSRGRHNPKLAAKKTSPTESNSKEQLRKETEGTAFRDRGNSSSKDRQTAIATRAINEDDGYGFRRITRQQHSEDSTGEHHYPDSSFTKSRDSYRDHDQRPRYSRKLQGRGRTGLTCGRYQVNSWDKNEQSIQSGELTEQLLQGSYDCVICCDTIQPKDSVWNCAGCYHIFHLKCIQKWARSSATSSDSAESGKNWRCPCCQRSYQKIPSLYFCFCGKVKNPSHNTRETFGYICPHSCGDVCGKRRDIKGCIHKCTMQCHPGPCPECPVVVNASCPCGRTMSRVRCSQSSKMSSCGRTCGKCLDCGKHFCSQLCHRGPCQPCERLLSIMCFCGKEKQTVQCSSKMLLSMGFSCTRPCGKPLGCRNHCCEQQCHRGVCLSCPLLPESTQHCPCGRTSIAKLLTVPRVSCLDPIPTCDNMCGRQLICGNVPKGQFHWCESKCHAGNCPPCSGATNVQCQCGQTVKDIPCKEFLPSKVFVCDRLCNNKKDCGRHRCSQRCCTDSEHLCLLPCNKLLRCGQHRCEERCHQGHCLPCYNAGFDELRCHCGTQVIHPPIPCGTLPPACDQPCSRIHDCSHPVLHNCHSEEKCPPCPVLVSRMCVGGHRKCSNVPCHMKNVSCGSACGKYLDCGQHPCKRTCHEGACLDNGAVCTFPCTLLRPCGHPCGSPCHHGSPCPKTICRVKVKAMCQCGQKTDLVPCLAGAECGPGFASLTTEDLATCMQQLELGQPIGLETTFSAMRGGKQFKLRCDKECAQYQRNKLLAEALNIDEPNLSTTVSVVYSPFLLEKARKEPEVTRRVEHEFTNLVEKAKKSEPLSYSFPIMKKDHRQIIHDLAVYYNCQSFSYDAEPKRSVVVKASKNSIIPSPTLMGAVQNS